MTSPAWSGRRTRTGSPVRWPSRWRPRGGSGGFCCVTSPGWSTSSDGWRSPAASPRTSGTGRCSSPRTTSVTSTRSSWPSPCTRLVWCLGSWPPGASWPRRWPARSSSAPVRSAWSAGRNWPATRSASPRWRWSPAGTWSPIPRTCREGLPRDGGHHGAVRPRVLDPRSCGWKPAPVTPAPPAAGAGPAFAPADRALRRERFGWYSYDWAMSVFNTSVTTVFLAPYLTSIAESAAGADGRIHPLGIGVPAGSFFGYVLSLSVLLQVLVLPLTGAIADRSGHKRQLLAGFATLGSLCTMAMFLVAGERYLLGASLFIVANLCFGAATVVYYSWLPDLAGPDERDAVSSRGWAIGYLGGALLLAANLALFTQYESLGLTEGEAVRICLASAGV